MSSDSQPFDAVIRAIDAANADDPRVTVVAGAARPYEVVYAERMTERLAAMYPEASENLRVAARAQHIRRWDIPRSSYPEGRNGYNDWRKACREHHGKTISAIMATHGYDQDAIDRVVMLIKKEQLKKDRESQALENVVDVVFVEHYIDGGVDLFHTGQVVQRQQDVVGRTERRERMSAAGHPHHLAGRGCAADDLAHLGLVAR